MIPFAEIKIILKGDCMTKPNVIEMHDITKKFGEFVANDHINLDVRPGEIHALLGENGAGKSTLLKQLYGIVQKENIPCVMFDNLKDGGSNARSKAGFYGDITFLATSMCSSEGENIALNMGNFAKMIESMFRNNPNDNEYWIFADAVDSGFSIDNVVELKDELFKLILDIHKDKEVYIVITANAYEMARGEQCFDVINGKYVSIKSYEKYRSVILKSRDKKDARYKK